MEKENTSAIFSDIFSRKLFKRFGRPHRKYLSQLYLTISGRQADGPVLPPAMAGTSGKRINTEPVDLRNLFLLAPVAGILLVYYGIHLNMKARAQKEWPTTEGIIKVSEVIKTSAGAGQQSRVHYKPKTVFEYSVFDFVYQSDKLSLSKHYNRGGGNRGFAEKMVASYPLNEKVTVYYDPDNLVTGLLIPGKLSDITASITLGIALIIGGIAGALNISEYID